MRNKTDIFWCARLAGLPALICAFVFTGCGEERLGDEVEAGSFRSLDDGLELYWTFEDNLGTQITDLSGKGRHGTLVGGELVSSPLGQAVSLDGVDDFISLVGPRSPALYGGVDGSFTISARVRVTDITKYNTLCYGCGPFSTMYVGSEANGPVVLSALDDQSSQGKIWPASSAALVDDDWKQVTLVVEDGASARYYLDCVADAQIDEADIGLLDTGYSVVGQGATPERWFGGEIDELRIWSRALSEAEQAQLCPTPPPIEQGLEMHWTFEDHIGDQILDVSGNGRHGTAVGATFVDAPFGQALSLDGVDDKVSFVGPRALSLYGGEQGDFTISARVRVADVNEFNTLCFGCGPFTTMYVGDPNFGGRVATNLYNLDTQASQWAVSSAALTNDEWAEFTLVVEGGVAARSYIDCTLDATLEGVNVGLRDPGYSSVGEGASPSWWYQGEIDELRVWSRALPDSELADLCPRPLCDGPVFVDVDAQAGGDGLSWATAFDSLQEAIDAASGCASPQLWLAEGSYAPDPLAPVATISSPMAIYGGFSGVEDALEQRDIVAHPVRLGADGWQSRVVVFEDEGAPEIGAMRLDGVRISGSTAGAVEVASGLLLEGTVNLDNLTITDNSTAQQGAGLLVNAGQVEITNSTFARNQAGWGGAVWAKWGTVSITDSSFVDNDASLGGALYLVDPSGEHQLTATTLSGNTASWGGAIFIEDNPSNPSYLGLTVVGGEFEANAADNGGGAIYMEESACSFDSVVFTGNTASYGGAIQLADDPDVDPGGLDISDCRFIANTATNGSGGGLRLQDLGTTVINTEFAANEASTAGGGVFGRGTFVSSTFAENQAGTTGSGLYAPAGDAMYMRHCVAFPDTIIGDEIYVPYSCLTNNIWLKGSPAIMNNNVYPFEPADFDNDGRTEYYLLPDYPCEGLSGGVIDEFDWSSLTVYASQCTDSGWPEPGVHYPPQSAVGPCE
jgi:predicted outer membrane repeat protein